MECTLATLVACFSWSNLYIDIGIQFQDRGDALLHEYELAVVDEAGREITDLRKELFFYRGSPLETRTLASRSGTR